MKPEVRQILDAIADDARKCLAASNAFRQGRGPQPPDAPHYVFASEGRVVSAYEEAALEYPESREKIWDELICLWGELIECYPFTRIKNAVARLRQGRPFDSALKDEFEEITLELQEIEFRRPGELKRRKGRSRYADRMRCHVWVQADSTKIVVGKKSYKVTGYEAWCIIDRVLWALWHGDTSYCIVLTSKDYNMLKDDARKFVQKYVERQVLPVKMRRSNRQQWTDRARFKFDALPKDS